MEPTESPEECSKPLKSSDTSIDAHPPTRDKSPSSSPSQSGSSTVDSKSQSPTSADELGDSIDLTSCCNVNFEMRDGCPGVRYQDSDNVAGWTPVVGRRRKKKRLPDFVLHRFPPDHPMQWRSQKVFLRASIVCK